MKNLRIIFLVSLILVTFTSCNVNFYLNSNNNLSADVSNEINIVQEVDVKETQVAEPDAKPITEFDTESDNESNIKFFIKIAIILYVSVGVIFSCREFLLAIISDDTLFQFVKKCVLIIFIFLLLLVSFNIIFTQLK